ncbi:MAG: hypothetical protein OEX02_03965 [Cyclobacteriaceae bacterium]|nr:hypothetical protein [Cyclobacteriaceae bacterium]
MKFGISAFLILLALVSCNKKLPKEEIEAFKKEIQQRKIRKISEQDFMLEAQRRSGALLRELDSLGVKADDNKALEQLGEKYDASLQWLLPGQTGEEEVNEIMEAYIYSEEQGANLPQNLQVLENRNFLLTQPVLIDSAGIKVLKGFWKAEFSRKAMALVL